MYTSFSARAPNPPVTLLPRKSRKRSSWMERGYLQVEGGWDVRFHSAGFRGYWLRCFCEQRALQSVLYGGQEDAGLTVYTSPGEPERKSLGRVVSPHWEVQGNTAEGKAKKLEFKTEEDWTGGEGQHLSPSRQVARLLWFYRSVVSESLQRHGCSTPGSSVLRHLLSLLKLMSIKPPNHFFLCNPILLLPLIFPSIRVFFNESVLRIRWPKYWSFSFSISPSNEHPGLISFRMDWLDLLAVQGTLKSLLQRHSSKASILWHSAFFIFSLYLKVLLFAF